MDNKQRPDHLKREILCKILNATPEARDTGHKIIEFDKDTGELEVKCDEQTFKQVGESFCRLNIKIEE